MPLVQRLLNGDVASEAEGDEILDAGWDSLTSATTSTGMSVPTERGQDCRTGSGL